jgi:Skp family chaperone for outer membrane proteins
VSWIFLQQIFDAFDQEECLSAALEAEQERTIASLMAEQEDLEHQLNNVSDDDLLLGGDDGSELEESELSVDKKTTFYFLLIFSGI